MNTPTRHVEAKICHNGMEETLRFLTDGKDGYTVLPKAIWRKLKLVPQCNVAEKQPTKENTEKLFSHCLVEIGQQLYETWAILGEKSDDARLGAITPFVARRQAA